MTRAVPNDITAAKEKGEKYINTIPSHPYFAPCLPIPEGQQKRKYQPGKGTLAKFPALRMLASMPYAKHKNDRQGQNYGQKANNESHEANEPDNQYISNHIASHLVATHLRFILFLRNWIISSRLLTMM